MMTPAASASRTSGIDALDRLGEAIARATQDLPRLVRLGGRVSAVTPGFYRVDGLSSFLKLGERVVLPGDIRGRDQIGEGRADRWRAARR